MCKALRANVHKGFSLIELLIVILIVSVVYFLSFEVFELDKPKPKPLTAMNLKSELLKSGLLEGEATLMCTDKCRTCYIRSGFSSSFEPYPNKTALQALNVYVLNEDDSLVRLEYGRFDDKQICLIMDFHQNGSSTQLILEDKEGSYFLPSFFGRTLRFDTPEDAKEYWVEKSHDLSDGGAFY